VADDGDMPDRLSRISTCWTLVMQAHRAEGEAVGRAQRTLMHRYCGAVYRYLLATVRDADVAEELAQEFALRFVRGDFKRANPERGRFRDFVKAAVANLVIDHHRRQRRRHAALPNDSAAHPAAEPAAAELDRQFVERWRDELLERAWEGLADCERETGQLYYTVLRWRAENPKAPASDLAAKLTADLGRPFSEVGVRQTLHRARGRFADQLLNEVGQSLQTQALDLIEQELRDLGLLPYCQPALERRKGQT
jgi:RNA polymerase sigma factor (sigma-70 family)